MKTTESTGRRESSHTMQNIRLMVRMNATLFYAVGAACLIEATAAAYAKQLLATYGPETALGQWIEHCWLPEKLERARLLQEYAMGVWPEVDWPAARAEFERNAIHARGALSKHRRVHEVLRHCLAAAQASVFYGVMSLWAEDVHIRELTRRSGASERSSFEHFKDAFELAHREERLGLWATFRESLACATHARDNVVRRAFEILQGHWSGTPPFPDVSYAEFLARAGSIARREGMLGWPHRVLLQPWFSQPSRRAPAVRDATQSSARGRNKPSPSRVAVCAQAAYAA